MQRPRKLAPLRVVLDFLQGGFMIRGPALCVCAAGTSSASRLPHSILPTVSVIGSHNCGASVAARPPGQSTRRT